MTRNQGGAALEQELTKRNMSHSDLRELAKKDGLTIANGNVGHWIAGSKKPKTQMRLWLRRKLKSVGIELWDALVPEETRRAS